ncbi:hypothetical protein MS3_00006196 [Schistosoma haematobium]|uniref:Secreted protein n=1 Tax=Schistosoma haematobium TaxID=6185 RepID=A0A922IQ36_SCHHA|nr:hypothetical protein MS3_00006196 [Schistosoma haematobium]KAH9584687.1 hypothetical protein MS3_00006196 [Schistosoma haematobium]
MILLVCVPHLSRWFSAVSLWFLIFLEAWHSGQSAINKHIEINPIYQPIRKIMHKYRNKNQTNGRHNQNKEVNNDKFKVNKNQSTSRCTEQAVEHIWRNSNTSLLSEVCADDVVQKNDESSTTKPSSSENKTPPKCRPESLTIGYDSRADLNQVVCIYQYGSNQKLGKYQLNLSCR